MYFWPILPPSPKPTFDLFLATPNARNLLFDLFWSARDGGLRDGGLSKCKDIWGKRPFSSVFWISQVLFAPPFAAAQLFLAYFSVFGVRGPLGGPWLLKTMWQIGVATGKPFRKDYRQSFSSKTNPEGLERHLDATRQKLPRDNFCRSIAAQLPSLWGQFWNQQKNLSCGGEAIWEAF